MRSTAASRNQRVSNKKQRKQQHLLEVTVRQEIAVSQRNRAIFSYSWRILLAVALVAGAWIGGREALRTFVWENPDYYLTDLRVTTDGALTREQILSAGGIVEGRNIFTIDLPGAREAIDNLPQVDRVEIQRVLPNRISVSVIERRPVAWVTSRADEDPSSSDKSFLIDARGVVMRSKTLLPDYLHLPVISGVELENLAPGHTVKSFEMQAALDLVRLNSDSTRFQARNIDLSKGYCLIVTDRTRAKITFGLDRVDQQLDRLNRLLDEIEPTRQEIQTVNLLVERNVPVTFVPPPEPEREEPVEATSARPESPREKFLATKEKAAASKSTPVPSREKTVKPKPSGSSRKSVADSVRKPFRP